MRKFLKSFLYLLFFGFLVFTGVFSYSEISKVNAIDFLSTSYTVDFFGSDNETIIYSLDVESGQSLNDLENVNLVENSYFSDVESATYVNSSTYNSFNIGGGWTLQANESNASEIILNSNPSLTLTRIGSPAFTFLKRSIDLTANTIYYITFSSNNNVYSFSYSLGSIPTSYTTYIVAPYNSAYGFWVRFEFSSGSAFINVGFSASNVTGNHSFSIDYLFVSESNFNYFNLDYVNQLYLNSGGNIGSNFEWSESSTSSSRFDFSQPIRRNTNLYGFNFNGEVFNFDGEISSEYSHLGNYAINDVEFFDYQGAFLYHIIIDTADLPSGSDYVFLNFIEFNSAYTLTAPVVDSIYFNCSNNSDFPNFFIYSEIPIFFSNGGYDGAIFPSFSSDDTDFYIKFRPNRGVVHIWFSELKFSPISRTEFELIPDDNYLVSSRLYDDVDDVVDMSANTNFTFDLDSQISSDSDSFFFQQFYNSFFVQDLDYFQIFLSDNYSVYFNFYYYFSSDDSFVFYNRISYDPSSSFLYLNFNTVFYNYDSFVNFYFYDNYFFVHRPVQRVDNTLVIYNFDYYNLLYSLNGITYTLLDNGDLYNVNYSGSVPNNYFIYLSNERVSNTIFDEYISVYLKYKNNYVTVGSIYGSNSVSLGFDFNFSYYVQPLVSNNGVYSYDFNKPDYVDMPFSLSPFYIPVLEIAENIMIFLVFYCPLISDILLLLHFDLFFGSLISIFDFIFNSSIGYFVLGCLSFLIYWSLIKLLFPSFLRSSRSAGQTFVDSFVSAQEVLDTPSVGRRYKPYKRKSSLGSYRTLSSIQLNKLSNYKYYGYSGKRNSRLRKFFVSDAKNKYKK